MAEMMRQMVDVYVQSVGDASRAAADGTTLDEIHAEYQQLHRRAVVDAAAVLSNVQVHCPESANTTVSLFYLPLHFMPDPADNLT